MSSNYYYLSNPGRNGQIGISRKAFEDIATSAANSLHGVSVEGRSGAFIKLTSPVRAVFHRDGKVEINISVSLRRGTDVHATCLKIQEAIAGAISMMTEAVPFSISVHVVKFR